MTRNYLHLILMAVCCFSFATNAQKVTLRVVTEDTFPIQYLQDGKVVGPATQLVESVLTQADIAYTIEVLPWARAYQAALTEPNTLIYSIARTPEREALFTWIGSVMRLDYYLVGLESLQLSPPVTLESLKKLRIGAIRNSATEQHLLSLGFEHLYTVGKPSQSIKMLRLNRIDLFPTNYSSFQFSCLHMQVECQDIKPYYQLDQLTASLYLALSNQTDKAIVDKVRSAFQTVVTQASH